MRAGKVGAFYKEFPQDREAISDKFTEFCE